MAITPEAMICCALPSQTLLKGSFRINGAWTYNTLPRIIRQLETLSELYTIKLKCYFKLTVVPAVHVAFVT